MGHIMIPCPARGSRNAWSWRNTKLSDDGTEMPMRFKQCLAHKMACLLCIVLWQYKGHGAMYYA